MTGLEGWGNFYVIVGSSSGVLIGLQFVVITLIAAKPISGDLARAGSAFATPSVIHFGVVHTEYSAQDIFQISAQPKTVVVASLFPWEQQSRRQCSFFNSLSRPDTPDLETTSWKLH